MSTSKRNPEPRSASVITEAADPAATDTHASRKLTFAENLILTIEVLAGFGLLGAVLWAINVWKSAK